MSKQSTGRTLPDKTLYECVLAQEEACDRDHNYVSTVHLLLGLIHNPEGVVSEVLTSLGVSIEDIRCRIDDVVEKGAGSPSGFIPFTHVAKKAQELSWREAQQLRHEYIGPEHLLLGVVRAHEGVASKILCKLGVEMNALRARIIEVNGR